MFAVTNRSTTWPSSSRRACFPTSFPTSTGSALPPTTAPVSPGTNAGGDWYDVVRRPDGITHFSVGDVAGRGIRAAVSMGQLRNAFRAYALEHVSPAAVVQRMARHVERDGMATMVCVTFDPLTYDVSYSSAGHVPPLLIDSEKRSVERLEDSASVPPLGWFGEGATSEKRRVRRTGHVARAVQRRARGTPWREPRRLHRRCRSRDPVLLGGSRGSSASGRRHACRRRAGR